MTVFLSIKVFTIVGGLVGENLVAFAVGTMVTPITFVKSAIRLNTQATSIHHIVDPMPLVPGATAVHIRPLPMSFAIAPIAKIVRFVGCLAESKAVLCLVGHVTDIDCT